MTKPELLSPAGDFESLKAAIYAGADAVYFGAKNFNARAKANNFGDDLNTAVAFVHLYGAKAYLTLNTLIENDDAENLLNTVKNALEAGIDAFIVQDFGVVNLIKNSFPDVEIHASTQMAVNNYLGALQAQEMGIKRVVLSRETSLEDIKLIKQNTNLEIEFFVQGALCVCFSGNCYLSSCLYSKSGNKGECLQPCRLPYKALLKGKQIASGYLLSAKDINLSKYLKELVEAGVDSFKIEGRLRRPAYVFSATKTYREIIDNNYQTNDNNQIDLKKAFNRGNYTSAYFNGNGDIIDKNIQGHIGLKIGKVANFEKGKKFNVVTINSTHTINKGDGLKFVLDNKEIGVITAVDIKQNKNTYQITTTSNLITGADVYLILDSQKEQADLSFVRRLPVDFKLVACANKTLELEYALLDEKTKQPRVQGKVIGEICQEAKSIPLDIKSAKQSLAKLTDTPFFLYNFDFETDSVFVSKQELNSLRKNAVEKMLNCFENNKQININFDYLNSIKIKLNNKNNYDNKYDFTLLKPGDYANFDYENNLNKNSYLFIPPFLRNADIILIKNILKQYPNLGIYANNLGALKLGDNDIVLGANMNIKNIFAINEILDERVKAIVTSPELSECNFNIIKNYSNVPVLKSSFEDIDLMTLVHCPIKNIFGSSCKNCKYQDGIEYVMQNGQRLYLHRYKIANCYFGLTKNSLQ